MSDPDEPSPLGAIDELLRSQGARVRQHAHTRFDVEDLRRRSARQHRRQQIATSSALATLVVVAGVAVAAARGPIATGFSAGGAGGSQGRPAPAAGTETPEEARRTTSTTRRTASSRPAPATVAPTRVPTTSAPGGTTPTVESPAATTPRPADTITVDFRNGFSYPAGECGADPSVTAPMTVRDGTFEQGGIVRLVVSGVARGDIVPGAGDEAIVSISCPATSRGPHAWLYAMDPAAAGGARRIAAIDPDRESRGILAERGISTWRLIEVRLDGAEVISNWAVSPAAEGGSSPAGFTLHQQWTAAGWKLVAPPQVTPAPTG